MKKGALGKQTGWVNRLSTSLRKSSTKLGDGIASIFTRGRLDQDAIEQLEEILIRADLGPSAAASICATLAELNFSNDITSDAVRQTLVEQVTKTLAPLALPIPLNTASKPHVILFVGVNGTGKTTTIGKYAKQLTDEGYKIGLVAADTFRAAAIQQLQEWGKRSHCEVITGVSGADPSGLVYDAMKTAQAQGLDVLLVDTAGRLHNAANLMEELAKLTRVLKKIDTTAPQNVVQVLDATTGQNALSQVEAFRETVGVTGLMVTKLDGSAHGGIVVALAQRFGLPIHGVGIGEGIEDLHPFEADAFARSLVNTDQ